MIYLPDEVTPVFNHHPGQATSGGIAKRHQIHHEPRTITTISTPANNGPAKQRQFLPLLRG